MKKSNPAILITIDVEDWFQVENFKEYIPFSSWPSYQLRVERNTHHFLDLFDSIDLNPEPRALNSQPLNPRATFFVLGWLAKRLPHLIREIYSRGHEIASHGFQHNLGTECFFDELKLDLIKSKKVLEDIIGEQVYGYRAPSFAINDDILKIIEDCGYLYDSSFNSFSMHSRYGHITLSGNTQKGVASKISGLFYELPISNINIGHHIVPWGGGAYFRIIPLMIFKMGVKHILKNDGAYIFYIHPWEVDPEQPRVKEAPAFFKFRHYINLNRSYLKLSNLIKSFQQSRFITCRNYISEIPNQQ